MPQLNNLALSSDFITKAIKAYINDLGIQFSIIEEGPDPSAPNKFIPFATVLGRKIYIHSGPFGVTDDVKEAVFAVTRQGAEELIAAYEAV